jgi:hypothetical protein
MENTVTDFIKKKNAASPFLKLANGESAKVVLLRRIASITKTGFGGGEEEALRLEMDVQTEYGVVLKKFDNSSSKFAQELVDSKVEVGDSFEIRREGEKMQTRYYITNIKKGAINTPNAVEEAPAA